MNQANRRRYYYAGRKSLLDRAEAAGDVLVAEYVRVQLEARPAGRNFRPFQSTRAWSCRAFIARTPPACPINGSEARAMMDESAPMADVIDGLRRAEHAACYEFCRRQPPNVLDPLIAGTERLRGIVFELECQQPQALMAWKFPDAYEPFDALPAVLEAACEGRDSDVYGLLAGARFADLAATATACDYLKDSAVQIKRYGRQTPATQYRLL